MTAAPTTPTPGMEHPAITLVWSAWALSRDPRLEGHWQDPNCPQPLESPPSVPTDHQDEPLFVLPTGEAGGCDPNPGPQSGGVGAVLVGLVRQEEW